MTTTITTTITSKHTEGSEQCYLLGQNVLFKFFHQQQQQQQSPPPPPPPPPPNADI